MCALALLHMSHLLACKHRHIVQVQEGQLVGAQLGSRVDRDGAQLGRRHHKRGVWRGSLLQFACACVHRHAATPLKSQHTQCKEAPLYVWGCATDRTDGCATVPGDAAMSCCRRELARRRSGTGHVGWDAQQARHG